MNSVDSDITAWRRQWLDVPDRTATRADLTGGVAREWRRTLLGLVPPALVTAVIGGGLLWRAAHTGTASDLGSAAGGWSFIAIAWAGCLWLGRGTWRPRNESTAAFLDLSIARCTGWIRAIPFALALYAAELVFTFAWSLRNSERLLTEVLVSVPAIVLGWIGLPGLCAAAIWWRRTLSARRHQLLLLRRQLADG